MRTPDHDQLAAGSCGPAQREGTAGPPTGTISPVAPIGRRGVGSQLPRMVDAARRTSLRSLRSAADVAPLQHAGSIPGLQQLSARLTHGRRSRALQHSAGGRPVSATGVVVPDRTPTAEDVAIAARLLRAYDAATRTLEAPSPDRRDLWTIIGEQQARFHSILDTHDPLELARYLCNVSRHDASIGIIQGDREYRHIKRDRAYRDHLAVMAKDRLVSLAEAVGCLPVENPEQGLFGGNLHADASDLVAGISERLGIDISPPDVDGGLLKLRVGPGLFGERDTSGLFTAYLLKRYLRQLEEPRICEIGGGSGRVAYWGRRLGLGSHTIIDLPHVGVVQGYYLLKSLPAEQVVLYGEALHAGGASEIVLWPNNAIDELGDAGYDLVLNQDSMPEMSPQIVDDYLRWFRRTCRGRFLSINHESKAAYGESFRHVSVPEAVAAIGGFELLERYPYWLRGGYVVELYRVGPFAP